MLEKSTCRSETVYWWKLVVEAAFWSPFFPPYKNYIYHWFVFSHKELRTCRECCFTWSIVQTCRLCWYLWFYTFVDLLPIMYKLSTTKNNMKMNSVQILWGFLCVYIKPKNTVHLIEEMPQSLELVPFFPIFLRVLCCFFLFNMKTTCYSIKEMIIIIIMLLTFIGCSTVFKPCSLIFSSYTIFWKWLLVTILLYIIYRVFLPWSL